MSQVDDLDRIRGGALDRIDRAERNYKAAFVPAVVLEAAFLAAFLALADLSNRTHWLILLAAVGTYAIVALGLIVLGAHVNRCTARIVQALELMDSRSAAAGRERR